MISFVVLLNTFCLQVLNLKVKKLTEYTYRALLPKAGNEIDGGSARNVELNTGNNIYSESGILDLYTPYIWFWAGPS